jgi:hypothetical protein
VNADGPNRSPNTETFPAGTVKSAEPLKPAIPASPRNPRIEFSILLPAPRACDDVPTRFPLLSQAVIVTVVGTALGLTMATLVVKFVSSQVRLLDVAVALLNPTTASWSGRPGTLCRKTPYPVVPAGYVNEAYP